MLCKASIYYVDGDRLLATSYSRVRVVVVSLSLGAFSLSRPLSLGHLRVPVHRLVSLSPARLVSPRLPSSN